MDVGVHSYQAQCCGGPCSVGPSYPVRVINHTLDIATVRNGTKIAVLEPIEDVMTVAPVKQPDTPLRSSEDLRQVVEECQYFCLFEMLNKCQDILATSALDLGRTAKAQHRIHTGGARASYASAAPLVLVKKKDGSARYVWTTASCRFYIGTGYY